MSKPPIVSKYVQHQSCAWAEKVNFITHIQGPYGPIEETGDEFIVREQVGCRKISPIELELCCLPFFVYGYRLGDILEIDPATYEVKGIIQKSSRYSYRIFFHCPNAEVVRIADHCKTEFGALFEWYNSLHCAVDIATTEHATAFCDVMRNHVAEKVLEFEDGC